MASLGSLKAAIFDKEEKKLQYQSHIRGLNAYDRHKKFVNDYVQFYGKAKHMQNALPIKTDQDTIREGYRFIFSEEDDMDSTWEKRLVKRYYDKLFKEYLSEWPFTLKQREIFLDDLTGVRYCIADMSQYKRGKIGLRWRTEKEVISGKGQFVCANKHCDEKDGLGSYEVNFSYHEAGESKQALVKLVVCKRCAEKLVYRRQKEKELAETKKSNKDKRKREEGKSDDTTDSDCESGDKRRKGQKTSSSSSRKVHDEEDFEEFLEGMFP